jgi:hypothetical protein
LSPLLPVKVGKPLRARRRFRPSFPLRDGQRATDSSKTGPYDDRKSQGMQGNPRRIWQAGSWQRVYGPTGRVVDRFDASRPRPPGEPILLPSTPTLAPLPSPRAPSPPRPHSALSTRRSFPPPAFSFPFAITTVSSVCTGMAESPFEWFRRRAGRREGGKEGGRDGR